MKYASDGVQADVDVSSFPSSQQQPPSFPPLSCPHFDSHSPCHVCFTELLPTATTSPSSPRALTIHVSHALSLLTRFPFHPQAHLLVPPLLHALFSFNDGPIASQIVEVLLLFCDSSSSSGGESLVRDVVAGLSELISSTAFGWSKAHVFALHLLGTLLNRFGFDVYSSIVHLDALVCNLGSALQLPSDEIRGEILFLLYKLSFLQNFCGDMEGADPFNTFGPKLIRLTLDILMKTQSDDVRLNSVAFLTVSTQRGFLRDMDVDNEICGDSPAVPSFDQVAEDLDVNSPLCSFFCEAIKGPLLSSNDQVQIGTLDLLFCYLSCPGRQVHLLVEESLADYVFEILRLSGFKDPLVSSCLRVLNLLSAAGQFFKQKLAVGFATLIRVLSYVSQVPFHPGQCQLLMLIQDCISTCPGVASASEIGELVMILAQMLRRHRDDAVLFCEAFGMVCSIYVTIMRTPSSPDIAILSTTVAEALKDAVLASLRFMGENQHLLLQSLYLLAEAFAFGRDDKVDKANNMKELRCSVIGVCRQWILPWLLTSVNEVEGEDILLGVLEAFHSLLIEGDDGEATEFAENLLSVSWFSFSYRCLGSYPTETMKCRVYLMISSLADILLGDDCGKVIRDAISCLPTDPNDLFYVLGQKGCHNPQLLSCQSAVLQILYFSSLYNERLAPEKIVLVSVEQYILVNSSDLLCPSANLSNVIPLVALYSLHRGLENMRNPLCHSDEAERLFIELVNRADLDLAYARIHCTSLKWLFQRERLHDWLSHQIVNLSRFNGSVDTLIRAKNGGSLDALVFAQLVADENTYAAKVFVHLLEELARKKADELELTSVVNLLQNILRILPEASNQICLNGIGKAIHILYYECNTTYSLQSTSILIWNLLCSVNSEALADDEAWVAVIMKLIDQLFNEGKIGSASANHLIIGILCLILHHSTNGALTESAKAIILSHSLASNLASIIGSSCSNGPAMLNLNETRDAGQTLVNVLLLQYFALKSVHSVLPGIMDWQDMLERSEHVHSLPSSINCHELCRLIHFGHPLVKLISSYSLLEIFMRLSERKERTSKKIKCTSLTPLFIVFEGLVFSGDARVATNCGRCLSLIIESSQSDELHEKLIEKNTWCRLIIEELVLSLTTPSLVPKSWANHYKAAVYVAVALLKPPRVPYWMTTAFDCKCLNGILKHLSGSNLSIEIVRLLCELKNSRFLNAEQIATINRLFQECRKLAYDANTTSSVKHPKKFLSGDYDAEAITDFLWSLISSETPTSEDSVGSQDYKKRLLDEIEKFFKGPSSSMAADAG